MSVRQGSAPAGKETRPVARASAGRRLPSLEAAGGVLVGTMFIVAAALASATYLRPRRGWHTDHLHLVGALALGGSGALLAFLFAAAAALAVRRHALLPPLTLTLAAVSAAALLGASLFALRVPAPAGTAPAGSAAAKAFAAWQRRVVPVVLRYGSVLRNDSHLLRRPPRSRRREGAALAAARQGAATLARDAATLTSAAPSIDGDVRLVRLTGMLQTSLRQARRGQATLVAALATAIADGGPLRRDQFAAAKRAFRQAQQAMFAFTFKANGLGARLNAGP